MLGIGQPNPAPELDQLNSGGLFGRIALLVGSLAGGYVIGGMLAALNWWHAGRMRLFALTLIVALASPLLVSVLATNLGITLTSLPLVEILLSVAMRINYELHAAAIGLNAAIGILLGIWQQPIFKRGAHYRNGCSVALLVVGLALTVMLPYTLWILPALNTTVRSAVSQVAPPRTFNGEGITFEYPAGWASSVNFGDRRQCRSLFTRCLVWIRPNAEASLEIIRNRQLVPMFAPSAGLTSGLAGMLLSTFTDMETLPPRELTVDGQRAVEQIYTTGNQKLMTVTIEDGRDLYIVTAGAHRAEFDNQYLDIFRSVVNSIRFVDD